MTALIMHNNPTEFVLLTLDVIDNNEKSKGMVPCHSLWNDFSEIRGLISVR